MGLAQTETNKNIDKFTGDLLGRLAFLENRIAQLEADEGTAADSVAIIQDQKAANTAGGTATSGSWFTRVLNTVVSDPNSIVSLASNQITLQAGTYFIFASIPGYAVNRHKGRLRNITTGSTIQVGTSMFASNPAAVSNSSFIMGVFTLTTTTIIEIQQQVQTTVATQGLGVESGAWGEVEVYTQVKIIKFN